MGKKPNKQGANLATAPVLPQKELYQRVNFALQSSAFLHSLAESSSERKGQRRARHNGENDPNGPNTLGERIEQLARGQMKTTKKMAAHTQLKLDPSIKRNMCRSCDTFLIPGLTARIRNRGDKRTINAVHTACLQCGCTVIVPSPPIVVTSDPNLDGPVRKKRREGVVARSKVAFHARERPVVNDDVEGEARKGHSLWADDRRMTKWGEMPVNTPAGAAAAYEES